MSLQRYLAASDMARVIRESPLQRKALEDANVAEAEVREAEASLLPQLNLEASALRRRSAGIRKATRWYPCASAWTPSRGFPTSAGRPPRSSAWSRRNGAPTRCSATSAGNCRTFSTTATRCAGGEQSLTQQVTESEQVGELYREQFEAGRRDVIDLLNVQRERFEAERQLINLRIERKRIEYRAAAQVGLLGPLLENRLNHGS